MRTTISIDDHSAQQLMRMTGEKTHAAAVRHALREYLSNMKKQRVLALRGNVDVQDNWRELRELETSE